MGWDLQTPDMGVTVMPDAPQTDPTNIPADPATGTPETVGSPPENEPKDFAAEAEKWKALARKHEAQAKANADKAKRLDELEEASKSETEKLIARAEAAEKAAAEAAAKALRADVAATKGVPASLLSGSTQEELEAAADALLAFKGATPKAPGSDGQGNTGKPVGGGEDQLTKADVDRLYAEKKYDEIEAARVAGRLKNLLGASTT